MSKRRDAHTRQVSRGRRPPPVACADIAVGSGHGGLQPAFVRQALERSDGPSNDSRRCPYAFERSV